MQMPPLSRMGFSEEQIDPSFMQPVSRKQSLKAYSKGDLIRYAMKLEEQVNQLIEREKQHG